MLGLAASIGIPFITDMIGKYGDKLVGAGIKKITGVDVSEEKLTPQDRQAIVDAEIQLKRMDLEELKLAYDQINTEEKEKTKRWESDNSSSSTFAKLVRPSLVVYLVAITSLLAVLDGNIADFNIKEHWITLFTSLTVTALGGYFTLRTYEKRTGTSKWQNSAANPKKS